ncbi:predicted protein [Lichtheimia corymbifera JMRC:FSU:9682]|uniref:Uncharacterized protein n=1 Tax=Lichtheimia corymbifera JMRC:FSU:9682 TaxID=1263082 RepID=A0A068RLN1_9FUNG|nr:predicted protein [Lichtheimia corymbifera JMRC:FSU:9682]
MYTKTISISVFGSIERIQLVRSQNTCIWIQQHHVVVCGDQADTIEAGVEKYWRMICTCPTPSNILWMFHGNTAIAVLTSTHWGYRFSLQSNHMPALGP